MGLINCLDISSVVKGSIKHICYTFIQTIEQYYIGASSVCSSECALDVTFKHHHRDGILVFVGSDFQWNPNSITTSTLLVQCSTSAFRGSLRTIRIFVKNNILKQNWSAKIMKYLDFDQTFKSWECKSNIQKQLDDIVTPSTVRYLSIEEGFPKSIFGKILNYCMVPVR